MGNIGVLLPEGILITGDMYTLKTSVAIVTLVGGAH